MTEAKYNSALLAVSLGKYYNITIQHKSVDDVLEDIQKYNILINKVSIGRNTMLIRMISLHNRYILVGYPVGYHFDVFKDEKYSLENKITFSIDLKNYKIDICRGGCGHRKNLCIIGLD